MSSSPEDFYEVQKINDIRISTLTGKTEYFVKWKGYSEDENTWQPVEHLQNAQKLINKFNETHKKVGKVDTTKKITTTPVEKPKRPKSKSKITKKVNSNKETSNSLVEQAPIATLKNVERLLGNYSSFEGVDPQSVQIICMGQKNQRLLYKVKVKNNTFWVGKEVLLPKYANQLVNFYEKGLILIQP